MKITDSFTFTAPQQAVWDVLMNPNAISSALPGVDALIPVEGEEMTWRATAKLGVANISGTYSGIVRMSELDAPTKYRLTVSGEGQHSIINGTALLTLTHNAEDGKTILTYDAEAALSGKLAGIGQRLVGAAAKLLAKMFFGNLAKQLLASQDSPAKS